MKVRTNIEYSFTADLETFHVGDYVKVNTNLIERYGRIIEIGYTGFEISVCGDDERLITIEYDDLNLFV